MNSNEKIKNLEKEAKILENEIKHNIEVILIKRKEKKNQLANIQPLNIQPLNLKSDYQNSSLPIKEKFDANQWNIQVNNINFLNEILQYCLITSIYINDLINTINATYLRQLVTTK